MLRVGRARGSAINTSVGELKNPRKGHAHAFRVDLAGNDSSGVKKYVLSMPSAAEKKRWMTVKRRLRRQVTLVCI